MALNLWTLKCLPDFVSFSSQNDVYNEHGTIDAISSDFGDQMTTQHLD